MQIKLYEIAEAYESIIDDETGEILDEEAFEAIQEAEDQKLECITALYQNKKALRDAIKAQKMELAKRQQALEKAMESIERLVDNHMRGRKWEGVHGKISYRKSTTTECTDEDAFLAWDDRWLYGTSEFKANKDDIGKAIKDGIEIPGWTRVDHNKMSIK